MGKFAHKPKTYASLEKPPLLRRLLVEMNRSQADILATSRTFRSPRISNSVAARLPFNLRSFTVQQDPTMTGRLPHSTLSRYKGRLRFRNQGIRLSRDPLNPLRRVSRRQRTGRSEAPELDPYAWSWAGSELLSRGSSCCTLQRFPWIFIYPTPSQDCSSASSSAPPESEGVPS